VRGRRNLMSILPGLVYQREWHTSSCMWTRRAVDAIGPWIAGFTWEDYEYDFRAGCLGITPVQLPAVLSYHRVAHGYSQLSTSPRSSVALQRAVALQAMAQAVEVHKPAPVEFFKRRIAGLLFSQALYLYDDRLAAEAGRLLTEAKRSWCSSYFASAVLSVMRRIAHLRCPSLAARIGRKCRPLIYPI
jgi:hypothetical protein